MRNIPIYLLLELAKKPDPPQQRLYLPMPPLLSRLDDEELEQEGTHVVVIEPDEED